jgi:hypothetical protein
MRLSSLPMDALLPIPPGYSLDAAAVGWLAAQLDDQRRLLERRLAGADRGLLEWQPAPGTNSIGMLLAHLAVAEAYWVGAALAGIEGREREDAVVRSVLGIAMEDDGMPVPEGGGHPASLAGLELTDYLALLDRARALTHRTLSSWTDDRLAATLPFEGRTITLGWVAYHLLEHFAQHAGQIAQLRSLRGKLADRTS